MRLLRLFALICAALGAASACAQNSVKVLWYRYASPTSHYVVFARWLALNAHLYKQSSGLRWDLTFFGPEDPAPDFTRYNVLVIESGEAFRTGPNRNADADRAAPDYRGILRNKSAIAAARGERTFISATDGDYHTLRGDSGSMPPDVPSERWDGARGHFINAVNWAGSGKGLGIVAWCDCEFPGSPWWQHPDSFLRSDLAGRVKYFHDNAPQIPANATKLYLNHGLTNLGLSNWHVSFHGGFRLPVPGYTPLIMSATQPGYAVAIATSASVEAPAGPAPMLQFVVDRVAVQESDGSVTLSVARANNAIGALTVKYTTNDASARAGEDYSEASGSLFFKHGEPVAQTITIKILPDRYAEGVEEFNVNLTDPSAGAVLGPRSVAKIRIADAGGHAPAPKPNATAAKPAARVGGCSVNAAAQLDAALLLLGLWLALLRIRYWRKVMFMNEHSKHS